MTRTLCPAFSLFLLLLTPGANHMYAMPVPAKSAVFLPRQWGAETLDQIQAAFYLPGSSLYAAGAKVGSPPEGPPAYVMDGAVQLNALIAAARIDRAKYLPLARRYAEAMRGYWNTVNGIAGFDVSPGPKAPDRYYGASARMCIALVDLFQMTGDRSYRDWAEQSMRFALSGQDENLGGGVYWHEQARKIKSMAASSETLLALLRLAQVTRRQEYLPQALLLYGWINRRLEGWDGLYIDSLGLDGNVGSDRWSYNSADMISANVLLFKLTGQHHYLHEADRIAAAAENQWVDKATGSFKDPLRFSFWLCEAFSELHTEDHRTRWETDVRRALLFLHEHARDPLGHYGESWSVVQPTPLVNFQLVNQAAAASAYWSAVPHEVTLPSHRHHTQRHHAIRRKSRLKSAR